MNEAEQAMGQGDAAFEAELASILSPLLAKAPPQSRARTQLARILFFDTIGPSHRGKTIWNLSLKILIIHLAGLLASSRPWERTCVPF